MTTETVLINEAFYPALLEDIRRAQKTIHLSVYIFDADTLGYQIAEALCEAALRKVSVRVIVDGVGSFTWGGELANKLEEAGVDLRVYHPLPFIMGHWDKANLPPLPLWKKVLYLFSRVNYRTHRKLCIIDDNIVYIGSANISMDHLPESQGGKGWRDTTIRLENLNTAYLEFAFERSWQRVPVPKELIHLFTAKYDDTIFYLNFTRRQRRKVYRDLLARIRNSKKRVWITAAYFAPDIFLQRALTVASKRGVQVTILISKQSDILLYPTISATFYGALLKHGVTLYEYLPSVLHAKILIIDDWFCVGSTNLNSRSLKHDLEVDVQIQSENAKKSLENQFVNDIEQSEKVELSSVNQSWIQKIIGWVLLLFSYWY